MEPKTLDAQLAQAGISDRAAQYNFSLMGANVHQVFQAIDGIARTGCFSRTLEQLLPSLHQDFKKVKDPPGPPDDSFDCLVYNVWKLSVDEDEEHFLSVLRQLVLNPFLSAAYLRSAQDAMQPRIDQIWADYLKQIQEDQKG